MSTSARDLLSIYSTRLQMQDDGTTNPSAHVKDMTRTIVAELSKLDGDERIVIKHSKSGAKFIHKATGKLLAELHDNRT
jgi:hypothetical protein